MTASTETIHSTMSIPWILTCPSSRGIGLGLTTHLLATTRAPIVATSRSDLKGTRDRILKNLSGHGITASKEIEEASKRLKVLEVDVTSNAKPLFGIKVAP